jgi:hypothetical protein
MISPPLPGNGYSFTAATWRLISVRHSLHKQLKKVFARNDFVSLLSTTCEQLQAEIFSASHVNSFLQRGHILIFSAILLISFCLQREQLGVFTFPFY